MVHTRWQKGLLATRFAIGWPTFFIATQKELLPPKSEQNRSFGFKTEASVSKPKLRFLRIGWRKVFFATRWPIGLSQFFLPHVRIGQPPGGGGLSPRARAHARGRLGPPAGGGGDYPHVHVRMHGSTPVRICYYYHRLITAVWVTGKGPRRHKAP